ncbi:MAG TPA: lipopolysaccharide heptosyltransferase I [Pseudomonadales bacterium]|nr:lipopolysaccharide heptosyltransferase I [Pseudomonadales bacterium]
MSETRILLVKTSSLGDVVHLLPALTEAAARRPQLRFDWLVEEAFAEIPAWHPAVATVLTVPFRAWRRTPLAVWRDGRWGDFLARLRHHHYDLVIDAQGLVKSAFLASRAIGRRAGPGFASAREPLAALAYGRRIDLPAGAHAVARLRALLGAALGYVPGPEAPAYGLEARIEAIRAASPAAADRILLLHGSSWPNKCWPEAHWCDLARRLAADGFELAVPWGTAQERPRAERIAAAGGGEVLPRGPLAPLFEALVLARGVVGVDSGLLHLAAAAGTPGVALFGPTDPARTGPWGGRIEPLAATLGCVPCLQRRCMSTEPARLQVAADGAPAAVALEPPCLADLTPARVQRSLREVLAAPVDAAGRPRVRP